MPEFFVKVDGKRLDPVADLETTTASIVAAVRAGGDFVEFASGSRVVSVLVTPSTSVTVHHVPQAEPETALAGDRVSVGVASMFPEYDTYMDYGI